MIEVRRDSYDDKRLRCNEDGQDGGNQIRLPGHRMVKPLSAGQDLRQLLQLPTLVMLLRPQTFVVRA